MKLLLVDDEKSLVDALSVILTHANYQVDKAYDGEMTLDFLNVVKYDVIILDIMMPKVDGYTVLKTLRERQDKTPVIILSAKSDTDDKILGLDLGADDYLPKPFEAKELLARIRAVIRRNNLQVNNILTFGNTSLNLQTLELAVGDKKVILPNKQFQIMELFFMKPGHVLSSEYILDKITNFDNIRDVSLVWVFISNLRKRLVELGSDITIKSNRGAGYYIERKVL